MRDLTAKIEEWRGQGEAIALATVVKTWGSAPRPPGAKMVINGEGAFFGSVSGGCVEGAVVEEAKQVLVSGEPRRLEFGVTNEQAWAVGLSCGGEIEVFVQRLAEPPTDRTSPAMLSAIYPALAECLKRRELVALATVVGGPGIGNQLLVWPRSETLGDLGSPRLNQRAALYAEQNFASFQSGRKSFRSNADEVDVFFEVYPPPPELIVVGAVHVAMPLVDFARLMGFRSVVIDPRRAFATAERFAHADELVVSWPREAFESQVLHEASYVVVLSHDLKIDLPALEAALNSPARYIGALGSKKTHAKRVAALSEKGFTARQIGRIHSPIGFDIGGRRAEEIALSIIAEMVAADHGRLGDREGGT